MEPWVLCVWDGDEKHFIFCKEWSWAERKGSKNRGLYLHLAAFVDSVDQDNTVQNTTTWLVLKTERTLPNDKFLD